jgi:oligopeptidase B
MATHRLPFTALVRALPFLLLGFVFAAQASCAGTVPPPPPPAAPAAPTVTAAPVSFSAPIPEGPQPPMAKRIPHPTSLHGRTLQDDYYWLRNKGTPEVESYLEAENAYADAAAKGFEPLAASLYDEMLARVQQEDESPPYKEGAYLYYSRTEKGKQYPIHCRKRAGAKDASEQVLLDLNEIGKDEKYIAVPKAVVSDDGNVLAYLVDTTGSRQNTLKVKDLRSGKVGSEATPRVRGVQFAKDGKTLFYATEDPQTQRSNKLFRHILGEDTSKDVLVYEEPDAAFNLILERTLDKQFIVVTSASKTTSEVRVIDAAKPALAPRVVAPREHDHKYYVDHRSDLFYVLTNSGGRNFRLMTAPVLHPGRDRWTEIVPHREDVMVDDMIAFQDHMILVERRGGLPVFSVLDYRTHVETPIEQAEPAYAVTPLDNRDFGAKTFRYKYESLTTAESIVEYDFNTKQRTTIKQTKVIGYDPSLYETKRVTMPARDGTPIPVSLVYRKGVQPDGTHPMLLSGYGSYGHPNDVYFTATRVSLLDRGFVYGVAHVRGGGENGKRWHDEGRMMSKMNTFNDFIDVAEGLEKAGWTRKDALVISGTSAGGLLVGAVANMRPDLFRVVLASAPFVDVLNTMLDETLPLTVGEFEEWGNPKNKDAFEYILQYCPYDNVKAQAYPALLVRSSYSDSLVMYWEPAKWVARLRATKTDTNPLLFKINMQGAGHGGRSGRFDRLHTTAWDYAFVLSQLGMK